MLRWSSRQPRPRGQGLVEFALVIPLFLLMLFGMIDVGRVIWANDALANAAREGARYASIHGDSDLARFSGPTATKQDIKDQTTNYAIAGGTNIVVTVCYSAVHISSSTAGCSGDVAETVSGTAVTNRRGSHVTVTATATVPILTGSLLGMGNFTVSGSSTVLINN